MEETRPHADGMAGKHQRAEGAIRKTEGNRLWQHQAPDCCIDCSGLREATPSSQHRVAIHSCSRAGVVLRIANSHRACCCQWCHVALALPGVCHACTTVRCKLSPDRRSQHARVNSGTEHVTPAQKGCPEQPFLCVESGHPRHVVSARGEPRNPQHVIVIGRFPWYGKGGVSRNGDSSQCVL